MKQITFILILMVLGLMFMVLPSHAQLPVIIKGSNHALILGHLHGPLKVQYFNTGDSIPVRVGKYNVILVVNNARRLNKRMAYYEQGFRDYSWHRIRRIFYHNTKTVRI